MTNPTYIVDIFQKIVSGFTPTVLPIIQANEAAVLGKTMIETIDYQYGHVKELIQNLTKLDHSEQLRRIKYPLVYLVQDFPEKRGQVGFYATVNLSIVIAHQTDNMDMINDRMRKVFKPVLYPIYYALMDGIASSDLVNENSADILTHVKYDRAYWGKQAIGGTEANVLNDYVDAIDITNLSVTILYNNC